MAPAGIEARRSLLGGRRAQAGERAAARQDRALRLEHADRGVRVVVAEGEREHLATGLERWARAEGCEALRSDPQVALASGPRGADARLEIGGARTTAQSD